MPKQIVRDVFGELLETGKQTVKQSKKAVGDVVLKAGKTLVGRDDEQELSRELYGPSDGKKKVSKVKSREQHQAEEIRRLGNLDKQKSMQMYKEIQEKILLERRKKLSVQRKYETGKAEFDEEQVKDPETFFEKLKKKREEMKKNKSKLSLSSKKGMGTGELSRGPSG